MIRSWGEKRRGGGGEGEVSLGLDGKRPPDCGLTADHPPDTHTHGPLSRPSSALPSTASYSFKWPPLKGGLNQQDRDFRLYRH